MYIAYIGSLLLQSQVLQPGAASGGSESWKMWCFNRVLPPVGQNPGKWRLFEVSKASNTFPRHPRGIIKGCGILLHAQLSYWAPGKQPFIFRLLLRVCHVYYIHGEFATSKLGASTGCCLRRVRILENVVFQLGDASGGSESLKMTCFNRVLPPEGQNPGKWHLFEVSKASNTFPRHPLTNLTNSSCDNSLSTHSEMACNECQCFLSEFLLIS